MRGGVRAGRDADRRGRGCRAPARAPCRAPRRGAAPRRAGRDRRRGAVRGPQPRDGAGGLGGPAHGRQPARRPDGRPDGLQRYGVQPGDKTARLLPGRGVGVGRIDRASVGPRGDGTPPYRPGIRGDRGQRGQQDPGEPWVRGDGESDAVVRGVRTVRVRLGDGFSVPYDDPFATLGEHGLRMPAGAAARGVRRGTRHRARRRIHRRIGRRIGRRIHRGIRRVGGPAGDEPERSDDGYGHGPPMR